MDENWNDSFTQLLRNTHPSFWGNWTLDGTVQPGAVGTIDPGTGAFSYLTTLPNAQVITTANVNNEWKVASSSVHQSSAPVNLNGAYTDPETGTKITVGLQMTWKFASEGLISSTFTLSQQAALNDFATQIAASLPWLKQQAQTLGMLVNNEITQGFGVITSVLYASCGLNIGSQSDNSSFSIAGSVDAVNAMAGNAQAGVQGSYATTNETSSFESHLWPGAPSTLSTSPVAIAFVFASFLGDQVLQGWVTNVSNISIELDDDHGGTYIVDAKATYDDADGNSQSCSASVSGGMINTMAAIPVQATNLVVELSFKDAPGSPHKFTWASPIQQFPDGQIIIDLRGVWPGKTSAVERTTGDHG